ncbi:DUF1062 domain-containing protein [uncultured Clostridium sp.]|uniref:DUF1062 domain-containing protein n=1 Tax=uncultured Clostridium sp. TaxID=59620 RepID=UPI0025D4C49B|nr:DUF1062 domain-containing protein [uncultured Clostridium sp.]
MSCYIENEENDYHLVFEYGTKRELFSRNSAVIAEDRVTYSLLSKAEKNKDYSDNDKTSLVINNPYGLKVRIDKVLCEILDMPRSKIKNMIKKKLIYSSQCINLEKAHLGRVLKLEIS